MESPKSGLPHTPRPRTRKISEDSFLKEFDLRNLEDLNVKSDEFRALRKVLRHEMQNDEEYRKQIKIL